MPKTLLCSAVYAETALLSQSLQSDASFEFLILGVGNVSAALTLQERLLAVDPPSEVILLGSAGFYEPAKGRVGDIVWVQEFMQVEASVARSEARIPEAMQSVIHSTAGPLAFALSKSLGAGFGSANCPDSVSLSLWTYAPGDYENMEGFGAASAASRLRIPFSAFFALTNKVGPEGSREWFENHKSAGRKLEEGVLSFLDNRQKQTAAI
ncbi:MAG: hypothetical protein HY042_04255 [Spirochaetia bacterium]|nr:hypothetical protein [Spirochaetia bacterium]